MQCTHPVHIQSRVKFGSAVPVALPCGKCLACRANRRAEWALRIMHEARNCSKTCFITLTYAEKHLPAYGSLSKLDLQLWLKRLRKRLQPRTIRFFASGEYGETYQRPHYHVLLFGAGLEDRAVIEAAWGLGIVHVGTLTARSASYAAKYVQKQKFGAHLEFYSSRKIIREFSVMSRRPGIGMVMAERFHTNWAEIGYLVSDGRKVPVPRAYRSRFTEDEKIWYNATVLDRGADAIRRKMVDENKTVYEIADKKRREADQVNRNLEARLSLRRNKI